MSVTDLRVRYGRNDSAGTDVLRNVTFSLSQGDTLVLLGPNGSGKSTLIYTIAGVLDGAAVNGEIQVLGRKVLRDPGHRRARTIAVVHQDPSRGTAAHLTLREHCELTATTSGRSRVTWEQVAARLQSLGTTLAPRQLAGTLSGGQRQLFTVLLAILSAPSILLLDEPTSSLDTHHAALVLEVISQFAGTERAAIFVTHDLSEARRVGNRLLVLNARGDVHACIDEKAKQLLDEPGLQRLLSEASAAAWTQRFPQGLPSGTLSR